MKTKSVGTARPWTGTNQDSFRLYCAHPSNSYSSWSMCHWTSLMVSLLSREKNQWVFCSSIRYLMQQKPSVQNITSQSYIECSI